MKLKNVLLLSLAAGCMIFGFLVKSLSAQDYYIEKSVETLVDGKPADSGPSLLKTWVKKDQVKYFNDRDKDNILLIHMDQDKAYQLNEKTKTVRELDLKKQFGIIEKEMQVSSQKTEKTKKVGQWDAYQVILTCTAKGASTEMEYWLSDAVKLSKEVRSKMAAYLGQKKIMEELDKYPGYPVEIDAHMDNKKVMVTKLVKIEEKELDQKLFEIPSEYKRENPPGEEKTPAVPPQADEKKDGNPKQAPADVVPGKETSKQGESEHKGSPQK